MARFAHLPLSLLALASLNALAQEASQTVTVTGRSSVRNAASVSGFGDVPLAQSPYSGNVISLRQLQDAGISSLGDITRLDAGTTDAYNAPGYWTQLAVRGYTLDARSNFRRDGLPINAETTLNAGNKQALEILKGVSGLQAGVSSPGGLVNLVVKRPQGNHALASLGWSEEGNVAAALDVSRRLDSGVAWRLSAEAERLDPPPQAARGNRSLAAGAFEARLGTQGLLEVEFEASHQSQPSLPGFSLLGSRLPNAADFSPRTNLNQQAWSLPVVFSNRTGSLRYTQALGNGWQAQVHAMRQHLRTDDRIAFPYGCSSEGQYDRYCSDGSFDLYDFRSEGERRTSDALDLSLNGHADTGQLRHHLSAGLLLSRLDARFNRQAFNWVGVGSLSGNPQWGPDATLTDENTHRSERSSELRLQDRMAITPATQVFAGLRITRLQRESVRTDGSRATAYTQQLAAPWVGIGHDLAPGLMAFANVGQGMETEVAPNRARYVNAGQPLPALKSHQWEVGLKQRAGALVWNLAAFDIRRPLWTDAGSCDSDASCTRRHDGSARHQGLEADAEWAQGALSLRGSALALRARREGAADPAANGLRPTNVPARSLKLQAAYNPAALPGLALLAFMSYEGDRMVLPDNSVRTPGWTRWDFGGRYRTTLAGVETTWRLGMDNAFDRRAWKEAPFQFGHAYLYPMPGRQWKASVQIRL